MDYAASHAHVMSSVPDLRIIQYDQAWAKDSHVLLRYTAEGSHCGKPYQGIERSDPPRRARWSAAAVFEVEDGRVRSFTKEWDQKTMQVGCCLVCGMGLTACRSSLVGRRSKRVRIRGGMRKCWRIRRGQELKHPKRQLDEVLLVYFRFIPNVVAHSLLLYNNTTNPRDKPAQPALKPSSGYRTSNIETKQRYKPCSPSSANNIKLHKTNIPFQFAIYSRIESRLRTKSAAQIPSTTLTRVNTITERQTCNTMNPIPHPIQHQQSNSQSHNQEPTGVTCTPAHHSAQLRPATLRTHIATSPASPSPYSKSTPTGNIMSKPATMALFDPFLSNFTPRLELLPDIISNIKDVHAAIDRNNVAIGICAPVVTLFLFGRVYARRGVQRVWVLEDCMLSLCWLLGSEC